MLPKRKEYYLQIAMGQYLIKTLNPILVRDGVF